MTAFDVARLSARSLRAEHVEDRADGPASVAAAAGKLGYTIERKPSGDAVLGASDAKLLRDWQAIYVRNDVDEGEAAALIAHELGHLRLHRPQETCTGADAHAAESRALAKADAYGPSERRELQANVFAREFLLPRSLARQLFLAERKNASDIAGELKLPPALVRRQLLDSLLGLDVPSAAQAGGPKTTPDNSQRDAAEYTGRALLLEAGPGSGKTRTLVMRVEHLLKRHVPANEIVALTFSNKAAGEISERIMAADPDAAAELWSGTFHAFGYDLIRRYYDRLKLRPQVQLIDRAQAIELLEDRLPLMGLTHYHDLRSPEEGLATILAAISRAKDELVDHEEFARRAKAALQAAAPHQREAAERACEAARVYEIYDAALRDAGAVDFGDLVMLPTLLLQHDDEVRAQVAQRHKHVLVDEYQDVNRASARMLMELYREGAQLWVVGDARQSLYRWRGASSENMIRFEEDFAGGQRLPLGYNYRSTEHIVGLGRGFAKGMRAGRNGLAYEAKAHRTEPGSRTKILVGLDDACEGELVAREVARLVEAGVPLGKQAVLAPTNARLDIMAGSLARHDIATDHLGSFFEREEVRDVLSVLALLAEANGGALVRVAAIREINVGCGDVAAIVGHAQAASLPLVNFLGEASSIAGISAAGGQGLERLGAQLAAFDAYSPAHEVAAGWLLDRSDYLRCITEQGGVEGASSRAALLALLGYLDQRELGGQPLTPARALKRIRRTMLLADDRDLRSASLGTGADAVRLMTIHGAKGLEFAAVHVVGLTERSLPGDFVQDKSPIPPGLIEPETKETHLEEEECLFFVAISRCEDHLRLYLTEKAAKLPRKPSPFLTRLGPLDREGLQDAPAPADAVLAQPSIDGTTQINLFDVRDHEKCPMRIAYRRYFGIHGRRHESPYLQTSGVLYELVDKIGEVAGPGVDVGIGRLLGEIWAARGPADHGLAAHYLAHATERSNTLSALAKGYSSPGFAQIELPIAGGTLSVNAPLVRKRGAVTEAVFFDAGRTRTKTGDDQSAGLLLSAARHALGPSVEVSFAQVTDGEVRPVARKEAKLAADLEVAGEILAAINAGALPPKRNKHNCTRCPYFVACPAVGAVTPNPA